LWCGEAAAIWTANPEISSTPKMVSAVFFMVVSVG
jgi:hypothetical protein